MGMRIAPLRPEEARESPRGLKRSIAMRMIVASIKPHKIEPIKAALERLGVRGVTISEARVFEKGVKGQYRGTEYQAELAPRLRLEMAVQDHEVLGVIEAVLIAGRGEKDPDGNICVYRLEPSSRIRAGEPEGHVPPRNQRSAV
jgi:nitrogen regulatory protein PII